MEKNLECDRHLAAAPPDHLHLCPPVPGLSTLVLVMEIRAAEVRYRNDGTANMALLRKRL